MSGLSDLHPTLRSIKITCDNIEYAFAIVDDLKLIELNKVLTTFQEVDSLSVIADKEYLDQKYINNEGPYAKLKIDVRTSLDTIGLTAIVATKLAENLVTANIVATYYNDYVFVKYSEKDKAIKLLESLKNY